MSYERSPREVCSTTMGTRFKPRSFMGFVLMGMCASWGRLRPVSTILSKTGELAKARGLVDDLHLRQCPVERLILQRRRLELLHGLAARKILPLGLLRVRVGGA